MTNKETVERNIGLTFDYVNYLMDKPELTENLPANFRLEFIEKDFPKLEKAGQHEKKGKRKYIKVKNTFEVSS